MAHVEHGGSWRPFWSLAAVLVVLVVLDAVLPGPDVPAPAWALAAVAVLGTAAAGVVAARRAWTVRVDATGAAPALSVGAERVPLAEVDAAHLRAVRAGTAGAAAGAPILGGSWSLPRGRSGLPLRTIDGRSVLVPTRDPEALAQALLAAVPDTPEGPSGREGTLGS